MTTPIKPSLATVHPRKPRPTSIRPVQCPKCDKRFEISMRAMSVRCPHCTSPLRFEDFEIDSEIHRDVNTMGVVNITPTSQVVGNVSCGQLTVEGKYAGRAKVFGRILLTPNSVTRGELVGKSLTILWGASFRGKCMIGPRFRTMSPPEKITEQKRRVSSHRPLRVLSTRRKAG